MKFGYARVSTYEQSLDLQIDALNKAGCEKIFTDQISGSVSERPGLNKLKELLRAGDTIVVWRLDRMGRSLKHLIEIMSEFKVAKVAFQSLQESIDTNNSTGQLIFHIFAALSEFERNLVKERTNAGLEAARARGRLGGRPNKMSNEKIQLIADLYNGKKHTLDEISKMFTITKPTLYRYVKIINKLSVLA